VSNLLKQQADLIEASVHWDPKQDTPKDRENWFEELFKCPLAVRFGFTASETTQAVLAMAEKFKIASPERMGELARIIREVFTRKLKEEEIKTRAIKKLGIEPQKAKEFLQEVIGVVKLVKQRGQEKMDKYFDRLPLIPAMNKYPKVAEQEITGGEIKQKTKKGVLKFAPTVKNWLDDYIFTKGAQAHNDLERGKYLFDSPNVKKLSIFERKKVSLILKSYDKDEALMISLLNDEPEIYFPPEPREKIEQRKKEEAEAIKNKQLKLTAEKEETENGETGKKNKNLNHPFLREDKNKTENKTRKKTMAGKGFSQQALPELLKKDKSKKEPVGVDADDGIIIENAQRADFENILKEEKTASIDNQSTAPDQGNIVRLDEQEKKRRLAKAQEKGVVNLKEEE